MQHNSAHTHMHVHTYNFAPPAFITYTQVHVHINLKQITQQLHSNQKLFWRWLKNIRGGPSRIPVLHYLGSKLSSLPEKVKAFNIYFRSIYINKEPAVSRLQQELDSNKSIEYISEKLLKK